MFLRAFIKRYCTWTKKYFINCLFFKNRKFWGKEIFTPFASSEILMSIFWGLGLLHALPTLAPPRFSSLQLIRHHLAWAIQTPMPAAGAPNECWRGRNPPKKRWEKVSFSKKKNISGGGGRVWCEFLLGGVVSKKEIFLFEGSKSKSLEQQSFWGICLEERWWFLGY